MNYIFITIIAVICFLILLGYIYSIVSMIEKRKMLEAYCNFYAVAVKSNGVNGTEIIDEILKNVNAKSKGGKA